MKTTRGRLSRITLFICACWLMLTALNAAAATSGSGDANGDGRVDALDAKVILQKAVSAVSLGTAEAALADVNGDGEINALDAILVLQRTQAAPGSGLAGFGATARLLPTGVEVQLSFGGASQSADSNVTLRLLDLTGTVLATKDISLQNSAGIKTGAASFALTNVSGPADLAGYIVEVNGQLNGSPFQERRSLYQVTPRLGAHVVGPKTLLAGGRERLRIVAEDLASQQPIAGATVEVLLEAVAPGTVASLYKGVTDAGGISEASFQVPQGLKGTGKLQIRVASAAGVQLLEQQVQVEEHFATFLTTDKPLYQPGQTIHIRTLTLRKPEMAPAAGREIVLTVADSKGNKVYRQAQPMSDYGVASAEFTLATELNLGVYTISAVVGETHVEKQVTVKRYSLPKFKVTVDTDKPYYLPGGKVAGKVAANYFFGKPVSGAAVTVAASKFDVEFSRFTQVTGSTDAEGNFAFSFDLPTFFVGQPLQQGDAFVLLEVSVQDNAAHTESITSNVPVAASELLIQAVPETGRLIPGVDNKVYLLTTYPNNTPARTRCVVKIGDQTLDPVSTDEVGIGVVHLTPAGASDLSLSVRAQDNNGNSQEKAFTFALNPSPEALLLRTDRSLYAVGDEVLVDVFTAGHGGSIFIDVIKEGQTLYSRSLDPEEGHAALVIPLAAEMSGTLSISAYRITVSGNTIRDRRIVYVDPANQLQLKYELSKDTYRPGEEASIRLKVSDGNNLPVQAAVGLNIVDESVFALQEMQPGMEKIYFYLEEQLRKPKYEIHGYDPAAIIGQPSADQTMASRDQALGLIFAAATPQDLGTFEVSSQTGELDQVKTNLIVALWKDLDPLITALQDKLTSYGEDRTAAFFADLIQQALNAGKLTADNATDPWGSTYRISYSRASNQYRFASAGPDQRWETADDMVVSAPQWILFDPQLRQNSLWELRRDKDGAVLDDFFELAPTGGGAGGGPTAGGNSGGSVTGTPAPYVRQYFPETLLSNPSIITGPDGLADLTVKVADSITSWRMTGLASSAQGRLGSATGAFRVFQEFFVDLDLPPTLTRGDEVSVPCAIYNYLAEAQDIRLTLEKADWFEMTGDSEKTVHLEPNQVTVAYFPVKTSKVGQHKLQVTALGSARSDAVVRQVEVVPDGSEVVQSRSGRLQGKIDTTITIPENGIEGASKILVKIYPGLFSQVVEGLDAILQMPSGCFEQTSSSTYPNVLALLYMKTTGHITPEVLMKAEGFIGTGYQRLLSFEVPGGGFEWFGKAPAHNVLTTYGLMEFSDMSKVWYVDPAVIARTQDWLVRDQKPDGSWVPTDGGIAEGAINRYQNDVLRTTAYVIWGLTASGYSGPALASGRAFIKAQLARTDIKPEIYTLALCAHALLSDPQDSNLPGLFQQFEAAKHEEGENVWWESGAQTMTYGGGKGANVELTALLAQAYMRYGQNTETAAKALNFLVSAKEPSGNFGSTQATVLALKAFAMAASGATVPPNATIHIVINGAEAQQLALNAANKDLLFVVDLQPQTRTGDNLVTLSLEGTGSCLYQVVGRSYVPWVTVEPPVTEPISIDVTYDKTELTTQDTVRCQVKITNNRAAKAKMIVIDTGLPPGFSVLTEDLDAMVGSKFQKYQLTPRQAIFYLEELPASATVQFSFRLAAKYPIRALSPQSVVYEYYNPEVRAVSKPKTLAVSQ